MNLEDCRYCCDQADCCRPEPPMRRSCESPDCPLYDLMLAAIEKRGYSPLAGTLRRIRERIMTKGRRS